MASAFSTSAVSEPELRLIEPQFEFLPPEGERAPASERSPQPRNENELALSPVPARTYDMQLDLKATVGGDNN